MYNIIVNLTDRTIIQLRFGPMVHCSKWYEDEVCTVIYARVAYRTLNFESVYFSTLSSQSIAENLEQDIKKTLSSVINENCSCDFRQSHISHGEFSCQTQQDNHVIYR